MHAYRVKGTIFSGEWSGGQRSGFGMKAWLRTGNVYIGQWVDGKKEGSGVLRSHTVKMGIGKFHCRFVMFCASASGCMYAERGKRSFT